MTDFMDYSHEFPVNGAPTRIATSSMGGTYIQTLTREDRGDGVEIEHWRYRPIHPGPDLDAIRQGLEALNEAYRESERLSAETAALESKRQ